MNSAHLERQFKASAVKHLLDKGILFELTYDMEMTDLNRSFAALSEFSGVIADVTGKVLYSTLIEARIPNHVVEAPLAKLVTESSVTQSQDREKDPPHIAIGKMIEFFRVPYTKFWESLADTEQTLFKSWQKEEDGEKIRLFTVLQENGEILEYRVHDGGRTVSFRHDDLRVPDGANFYHDEDGARWKKISTPSLTNGFNNIRADDPWVWSAAFMAGHRNGFLTHTKKYHHFRTDTLAVAKLAWLLNDQGENGFQAGHASDQKTGEERISFRLSKLMEANTRLANPERGLTQGVLMPDGSVYEKKLAHGALYDTLATVALKSYIRGLIPDLVRIREENADFDAIKPFLIGREGFAIRQLLGFMRNGGKNEPELHIGLCVGINEQIEERRQAILIRTDTDTLLKDYTYKHKHLADMSVDELTDMLRSQRGQPDALFQIVDLRKSPDVIPALMAFDRGKGGDPERHEINRRYIMADEGLIQRIMDAQMKAMPPMITAAKIPNPQAEEEIFTQMGELKLYEVDLGNGKKTTIPEDVHSHAVNMLQKARSIDTLLRKVIEPDPIEWESSQKTLEDFFGKIKKIERDLKKALNRTSDVLPSTTAFSALDYPHKKDNPVSFTPEMVERTRKKLVSYIWELRATFLNSFNDYSLSYKVIDKNDHEVPFADLCTMPNNERSNRLRDGDYQIRFEQLNYSAEIVAGLFQTSGNMRLLPDRARWETYFAARKALRVNGAPHEDVDDHRWMSAQKGLKDIARIRLNARMGKDRRAAEPETGLWETFVSLGDKGEPILEECERYYKKLIAENPLTPARMRLLGYDSDTGLPREKIKYLVRSIDAPIIIDVPDKMLEAPLSHLRVGTKFILVDANKMHGVAQAISAGTPVLLRASQSARVFLGAKAKISTDLWPNEYFSDVYQLAKKRSIDSGIAFPKDKSKLVCLTFEDIVPLTGWRPINRILQTLKIPQWEDFLATVSPALGLRDKPLTGFVLKDYGFTPQPGPARLQGMIETAPHVRTESGWEIATKIKSVRTRTLKNIRDGAVDIDPVQYGFAGQRDMRARLTQLFADQDQDLNSPTHLLHFVDITSPDKEDMTYFKPDERPVAVFQKYRTPKQKPYAGIQVA